MVDKLTFTVKNLCVCNGNGDYCIGFVGGPPQEAGADECIGQTISTNNCSASCNTIFSAVIQHYGCCIGFVDQFLLGKRNLTSNELAAFNQLIDRGFSTSTPQNVPTQGEPITGTLPPGQTLPPGFPDGGSPNGNNGGDGAVCEPKSEGDAPTSLQFLGLCASVTNVTGLLSTQCVKQLAALKIPGVLRLKLNYSAFQTNTVLMNQLLTSIGDDIALSLGVASDEIVDRAFSAVSSRRRELLQANPGVNYNFNVQTTSAANTQSAGTVLNSLLATGGFDLTNTINVIQESCPTCASAADLQSLAAEGGTPVPTPAPPGSTPAPGPASAAPVDLLSPLVALLLIVKLF